MIDLLIHVFMIQVRTNYLETIDNIQLASTEAIMESQANQNSTGRFV